MAKKETEAREIIIPTLRMASLRITIQGQTPLICHRFSDTVRQQIEGAQQGAARTKKPPRNPEQECREACYYLDESVPVYGFPAVGVKRAMVTAGSRFGDEKSTQLNGVFSIPAELLELHTPGYRMRSDRVVLSGIGRTSSIAYRPEFQEWSIVVPLTYNADFITPDQLVNLLRLAGFSVGLGDWRPEKRGSFGQFNVINVEVPDE